MAENKKQNLIKIIIGLVVGRECEEVISHKE